MQTQFALRTCALVLGAVLASGAMAAEGGPPAAPAGAAAGGGGGMQQSPAAQAIAYRKAVYTVLASNWGPIGGVLQGRAPYDAKDIAKRAERVAFMAGLAAEAFPEVSKDGDTKAKPEVWTDAAGFEKAMSALVESTGALAALVKTDQTNSDAFKAAATKVGQACRNCHQSYRAR
jgi:cytochrome c556